MRQAWHIFRKDIRHLWPFVLVWNLLAALLLVGRAVDPFPQNPALAGWRGFLEFMLPAGWLLVVATVVQQETLPGTTQFWLARPYDRRALLAAKAMFVVLCLNAPLFALQATCLALHGMAVAPLLAPLAWSQVSMFLTYGVVGAAVAALTRHVGHFALTALGAMAALVVAVEVVLRAPWGRWGSLHWMPNVAQMSVMTLAAIAVVSIQYSVRRTRLAAVVGATGLILSFLAIVAIPFSAAIAWQTALSPGALPALRVSLDAPRSGPLRNHSASGEVVEIRVPVRVEGLGERDLEASFMRGRFDEGTPVESTYSSVGRDETGAFVHVFHLPRDFYERHKERKAGLEWIALANTYRAYGDHRVPAGGQLVDVPGLGTCGARRGVFPSDHDVRCIVPASYRDRVLQRVEREGQVVKDWSPLMVGGLSLAASLAMMPVRLLAFWWRDLPADPSELTLRLMRLEASGEVRWSYENFRLADYIVKPKGYGAL